MAKQDTGAAKNTPDLLTGLRGRGRPVKVGSLTAAQRQAKFRAARVQVELGEQMADTVRRYASEFDLTESEVLRELVRFALTNRNWTQEGF